MKENNIQKVKCDSITLISWTANSLSNVTEATAFILFSKKQLEELKEIEEEFYEEHEELDYMISIKEIEDATKNVKMQKSTTNVLFIFIILLLTLFLELHKLLK